MEKASDSDTSEQSSPSEDAKSAPPPRADDTKSSPPPPDSSSTLPPASSPPPPDSSPPPPAASPPPPTSESPPQPKEKEKHSPPSQKDEPPPSPPPAKESTPSSPPAKEESPPSAKEVKTPSPEKSPETPVTHSPASSPSPPAVGTPPAMTALHSHPPLVQPSAAALSPPVPAAKSTPPSGPGSGSSNAPPPASSSDTVSAGVIAGVAVVGVGLLAAIIICLVCAIRKKRRKQYYMDPPGNRKGDYYGTTNWNTQQNPNQPPGQMGAQPNGCSNWSPHGPISGEHGSGFSGPHGNQMGASPNLGLCNQSSFSYEELARATNGFAQENVLGQGGFGYVHKGVLSNGKEVAVKSLKSGSGQGDREFQAEVDIISRVHHRHLVSLVGYCVTDGQRMLVYEFVPNKTLEFHLHGKGQPVMQWSTRMRIALGAAKGLAYLHEDCHPKIIHRDIKAANILLDYNFDAMVADFGLAKLTTDTNTHVSTRVMGTFGYMAPEYASSGKLTDKSDVFSFGVMLLELITGRRPIDQTNQTMEDSLVDWARPLIAHVLEDGNYRELVDPLLENNFDQHEMDRMISCAAASVRHSAKRRPKMIQIVRSLEGDKSSLDDTAIKSNNTSECSGCYDTTVYNADMMKFKKMVMADNYMSGELERTGDYGLRPSTSSSDVGSWEFDKSDPQKQRL